MVWLSIDQKHSNKIKSLKIKYVNNVLQGKGRKKYQQDKPKCF